ncbi:hypothetical protein GCM10012284_46640 [Mangrovihabitans endophyticus]|uniref:Uncharacterized protein n=1 Tax=Mangrovihabitans endophyticus TaxID=1751298 RepID=A0A8J3C1Z2_9ACTN|nr:hypothetical protein GCM10012284_46640 [Mangrovihabitans endophyticus]
MAAEHLLRVPPQQAIDDIRRWGVTVRTVEPGPVNGDHPCLPSSVRCGDFRLITYNPIHHDPDRTFCATHPHVP